MAEKWEGYQLSESDAAKKKKQELATLESAQKHFTKGSDSYNAIEQQKYDMGLLPMKDAGPEVVRNSNTSTTTIAAFADPSDVKYNKVAGSNVLNSYRSYTYNFTLAALDQNSYNDPATYRGKPLTRVVLTSKGKGNQTIASPYVPYVAEEKYPDQNSRKAQSQSNNLSNNNSSLVNEFNQSSPGRFDMYIDDVEIQSIMMPGEVNGYSQSCSMSFTVIEPYSINGFLEALHTTALSAGYPNYLSAKFIMLVEFVGYPDNQDLPTPENIEYSTRYFPLLINSVDLEVTEKGTMYKCAAVTPSDRALGKNTNSLKATINMKGKTVYEILTSLMSQLNKQIKQSDDSAKSEDRPKHDVYKIAFPTWSETDGLVFDSAKDKEQIIAKTKMQENLQDSIIYKFINPAESKKDAYQGKDQKKPTPDEETSNPEKNKPNPYTSDSQIQISESTNIHDVISAVIRDSEYVKNIYDNIKNKVGTDGMVEYFMVRVDTKDLKEIDKVTNKPLQEITYVVTPFKVHHSLLSGYENFPIDHSKLQQNVGRVYNYIYMGKNVDILNFKLEFNNTYFEAIGKNFGNTDQPSRREGAASNQTPDIKIKGKEQDTQLAQNQLGQASRQVEASKGQVLSGTTPNAIPVQSTPYYQMARGFHEAIIKSDTALVSGEMEIIGDPYYLSTGGWGNYNPKIDTAKVNSTVDGEVVGNRGELQIAITFNNPIDYEEDGFMKFDKKKIPFGGVYKVITLVNTFKDGMFKQKLNILRVPGQYIDTPLKTSDTDKSKVLERTPNPINQQIPISPLSPGSLPQSNGTAAAMVNGLRPDALNLQSMVGRGLPNPTNNFTDALGGLGGISNPLLNQVSGAAANGLSLQSAGNAIFGGAIPGGVDQLASGIRMQASGIYDLAQSSLGTASSVIRMASLANNSYLAGQTAFITGNIADESLRELGVNPILSSMASRLVSQQAAKAVIKSGVLGSGLGKFVTKGSDALLKASGALQKVSQIASINPQNYIQGLASSKINSALNMSPKDQAGVLGLASAAANITANSAIKNIVPTSLVSTNPLGFTGGISDALGNNNLASGLISNNPVNFANNVLEGNPINPRSLANTVGIDTSQISGLSSSLGSFISKQISNIANAIPEGVDLKTAQSQGVILDNLTSQTIGNLPPTAPYKSAPAYIADSSANGSFTDVNSSVVPGTSRTLFDNGINALNQQNANMNATVGAFQSRVLDSSGLIVGNQLSTYMSGVPNLTGYAGSVESAQSTVNSVVGSFPGNPSTTALGNSVITQFGSKASASPLQKLISG